MPQNTKPDHQNAPYRASMYAELSRATEIYTARNGLLLGTLRTERRIPERSGSVWVLFAVIGIAGVLCWLITLLGVGSWGTMIVCTTIPSILNGVTNSPPGRRTRNEFRRQLEVHFGHPRLIALVQQEDRAELEELDDVPFEPFVAQYVPTIPSLWTVILIGVPISVLAWFLLRREIPYGWVLEPAVLMWPVAGIVIWLKMQFWGRYYRITPGRLELLRFSPFKGRERSAVARSWDLRTARIECLSSLVEIFDESDAQKRHRIDAAHVSEPRAFVTTLFLAAISTHEAQAMPADRLTE